MQSNNEIPHEVIELLAKLHAKLGDEYIRSDRLVGVGREGASSRVSPVPVVVEPQAGSSEGSGSSGAVRVSTDAGLSRGAGGVQEAGEVSDDDVSSSSVSISGGRPLDPRVKTIAFGEFPAVSQSVADAHGKEFVVQAPQGDRLMKQFVKTGAFDEFRTRLVTVGVLPTRRMATPFMFDLALSLYTVGTMPSFFIKGRLRHKLLASRGDLAMSLALVERADREQWLVSSVQELKSKMLSNSRLSSAFVTSGLSRFVVTPAGIDMATAKSGADAVEAMAGALYKHRGMGAVVNFMVYIGVYG